MGRMSGKPAKYFNNDESPGLTEREKCELFNFWKSFDRKKRYGDKMIIFKSQKEMNTYLDKTIKTLLD